VKPLDQCRLYTFVDSAYLHGRQPGEVARELCEGGSDIIQLRVKGATSAYDWFEYAASSVRSVTRDYGVGLVINDWPALAESKGAEFCHLGQEDYFEAKIRPGRPTLRSDLFTRPAPSRPRSR
jgi:thiamine monophosphate synthase